MSTTQLGSARVELEVTIEAPREKVWQGLVEEIGEWWPRDFFTTESPRFTLDPRVGGYMYEDTGDGTGVFVRVTAVARKHGIPINRTQVPGISDISAVDSA